MSDFADTSDDVRTEASSTAREASRRVGNRARQLREGYSNVQENLIHASDDLGDYVRQNPGRSILVAAGLGFLIGMLLRAIRD